MRNISTTTPIPLAPIARFSTFLLASVLLHPASTSAQTVFAEEYFNNYGETQVDLNDTPGSAENGWTGAWYQNGSPDYHPGTGLTYAGANYSNTGNQFGPEHGSAGYGGGSTSGIARRALDQNQTDVWVSALLQTDSEGGSAHLYLSNTNRFVGISSNNGTSEFAAFLGEEMTFIEDSINVGETYLVVAHVTYNVNDGSNEGYEFWLNPTSASSAELGTPLIAGESSNAGSDFSYVGVGIDPGGSMDSIRIGDSYEAVMAIPEPGTWALISGFCALGLMAFRHRKR